MDKTYVVLVVDDEAMIIELVRDILEDHGYLIRLADSGEKALACLAAEKIDLVISDIMMEGMTGFELFNMARRLYPDVRLAYMTGHTYLVEPIKAAPVITKPFTARDLIHFTDNMFETSV